MKAKSVKTIESLGRGITVLLSLQKHGPLTLAQLHEITQTPKASLLRILKTLVAHGVVWQRLADNAYIASVKLRDDVYGPHPEARLIELAAPIMRSLSQDVKWPSVLALPRLTHMEVMETNALHSEIEDVPLGPIGFQINMLRSASGRAYLAFCAPDVRDGILARLRTSPRQGDRLALNPEYVSKFIRDTHENGYALRDPDFGGDYDLIRQNIDDKRNSIAVPILHNSFAIAAINITWKVRSMATNHAVEKFEPALRRAADQIARAYQTDTPS